MTSFYIENGGSNHALADSEHMAGLLHHAKFEPKEKLEEADIVIFNICTAENSTSSSFLSRVEAITAQHPYKLILITGCLAQAEPEKFRRFSLVGPPQIHHIVEAVEETLHNNIVKMLDTAEMPPLNLPKIRKNPVVEIIPIARSWPTISKKNAVQEKIQSYLIQEIVEVAQKAVQEGVKEILLTSHDTGSYGFDGGTNLAALLKELVAIPGMFRIRLDRANPHYVNTYRKDLLPLLDQDKMVKFVHFSIPLKENSFLKNGPPRMNSEEFTDLVQELRLTMPELTLVMDITIGFPTETDEEQWETLNLLRKASPDMVNLSSFVPKPKTAAAKLPPLPPEVVTHRIKVLTEVVQNISKLQNERWKGWEGEVIIHESGIAPGLWIGRNKAYKPIAIEGEYRLGDIVPVRITKVTAFELKGEVIKK